MTKKSPEEMLMLAEGILEKHPHNVPALKLLATAAQRIGWPETADLESTTVWLRGRDSNPQQPGLTAQCSAN